MHRRLGCQARPFSHGTTSNPLNLAHRVVVASCRASHHAKGAVDERADVAVVEALGANSRSHSKKWRQEVSRFNCACKQRSVQGTS